MQPATGPDQQHLSRNETAAPTAGTRPAYAGPSARRLARELGVAIEQVSGATAGERISTADIKRHVRRQMARRQAGTIAAGQRHEPLEESVDVT